MPNDSSTYLITWTTYGTWLPGDARGWRKTGEGNKAPRPRLAHWCSEQMNGDPVVLTPNHRQRVEGVCQQHADIRKWEIHAVAARSNHVHIAVKADKPPATVRDQFKANASRVLREKPNPITAQKIWTRGGDCEAIADDQHLQNVIEYINNQDNK